jgi:iron-sulfur cluster repair protein YtfE (RIC family)
MARRHDQLIPLTHDHHHALRQARQLALAADSGEAGAVSAASRSFMDFYDRDLLTHFHEEEEQLLPLLAPDDEEARALVTRTVLEHVDLHRLVRALRAEAAEGPPAPQALRDVSTLLRSHIRMEEDRLFPLIEQRVPDAVLSGVHLAPRSRAAALPATCPHCGHPIEGAPVDAGARGETGSAEVVCTACGSTIRLDKDA